MDLKSDVSFCVLFKVATTVPTGSIGSRHFLPESKSNKKFKFKNEVVNLVCNNKITMVFKCYINDIYSPHEMIIMCL